MNLSDLISQPQAASLRGVTREAINDLVKRGKLKPVEVAGRLLLSKKQVLSYERQAAGRPASRPPSKKKTKV